MSGWPAPVEWVAGRSHWPWFFGFVAVWIATFFAADVALSSGFRWAGVALLSPSVTLLIGLASIAITVGPTTLWVNQVPYPASKLGVSPEGIVLDYGLRVEQFSWDRANLRGRLLEVRSRRLGWRSSFSLTPHQADRVAYLRPLSA